MVAASTEEIPVRNHLLQAAARLLAEHGPDALTTRRLAAEVGTSTMAVYTYFGGKPSLLRALYREGFVRFGQRLEQAEKRGEAVADLRELVAAYRGFALENPHFYAIMFGPGGRTIIPDFEDLEVALATFVVLVDAVQRCVEDGVMAGPAQSVAFQIWAALHGAVSLELAMPAEIMPFASGFVFDSLVETVLAGLARPGV